MTIWDNESAWPNDFEDFTFLARAVRLVGEATFPAEWQDTDPVQKAQRFPKRLSSVQLKARHTLIRRLLQEDDPNWNVPLNPVIRPPGLEQPAEQWEAKGAALLQQHGERTERAIKRFKDAKRILLGHLVSGAVKAAYRADEGGELLPLDHTAWNSESVGERFLVCKLNPQRLFQAVVSHTDAEASWIFVNQPDLDRILKYAVSQKQSKDAQAFDHYISDILEDAIKLSKILKKDLLSQLKIDSLKKSIRDILGKKYDSGTIEALAIVLRDAEARKGTGSSFRNQDMSWKLGSVHVLRNK